MKNPLQCVIYGLFFIGLTHSSMAKAPLSMQGSSLVIQSTVAGHERALEERIEAPLLIKVSNSSMGLKALQEKACDIALISAPLSLLTERLARMGTPLDLSLYHSQLIGHVHLALIAHASLPDMTLSHDDVLRILTGDITHWEAFSQKHKGSIQIITEHPGGGLYTYTESILLRQPLRLDKVTMDHGSDIADAVAQRPLAIGLVPLALAQSRQDVHILAVLEDAAPLPLTAVYPKKGAHPKTQSMIDALKRNLSPSLK